MALQVLLSTTGTVSSISFADLNGITFNHPTSNFDLLDEYPLIQVLASTELKAAIDAGEVTVDLDDGTRVLDPIADSTPLFVKQNRNAVTDPTVNDDIDLGYSRGSVWINTSNNSSFICTDNTDGAAVWVETTAGAAGDTNVDLLWMFSTTTIAGDPGPGFFRYNTATLGSVTNIYLSNEASNGINAASITASLTPGETIYIQQAGEPTKSALFTIISITDNSSWVDISVSVEDTNVIHDNATDCGIHFIYTSQINLGMDDLSDADTTTVTPVIGDSLIWDGTNWVPSNAAFTGGVFGNNYVFAIDTTTQNIVSINTYQGVTFNTNVFLSTWSHTPGSSIFTAGGDGLFAITYEFNVEKGGGGNINASCRALFNGVEIIGSHAGMDVTSNNTAFSISRTFLLNAVSGQDLVIQFAANNANAFITAAPNPGSPTTAVAATITIRRMT
jgi:hypothetical protein